MAPEQRRISAQHEPVLAGPPPLPRLSDVDGPPGEEDIEVRLPTAEPALYLRWVAFLRTLEAIMHDHPPLAELARQESGASFTDGQVASFVAESVIPSLRRQAFQAITSERTTVAPTLTASRVLLHGWLDQTVRQGAWLGLFGRQGPQRLTALGLKVPDADMRDLLQRIIAVLGDAGDAGGGAGP